MTSLPPSQEMKNASNASLNDSHGDHRGTTDVMGEAAEQTAVLDENDEAEPTSAVFARAFSLTTLCERSGREKCPVERNASSNSFWKGKPNLGQNTPQQESKKFRQRHQHWTRKKRAREDCSLRGSCRKRSRTAADGQPSEGGPIRVIVTCLNVTARHTKVCNSNPIAVYS